MNTGALPSRSSSISAASRSIIFFISSLLRTIFPSIVPPRIVGRRKSVYPKVMQAPKVHSLSVRYTTLSDRFRSLWTFYQFLGGVLKHLDEGPKQGPEGLVQIVDKRGIHN